MCRLASLLITLYIDDAMASIHAHITTFNGSINVCSYTTAAYDIVTFLQGK